MLILCSDTCENNSHCVAGHIDDLEQGFSNFWCYGSHEKIDYNLRSPTRNFINAVIASLDSLKISQVSILISKRIARGVPRFLSRSLGVPYRTLWEPM